MFWIGAPNSQGFIPNSVVSRLTLFTKSVKFVVVRLKSFQRKLHTIFLCEGVNIAE